MAGPKPHPPRSARSLTAVPVFDSKTRRKIHSSPVSQFIAVQPGQSVEFFMGTGQTQSTQHSFSVLSPEAMTPMTLKMMLIGGQMTLIRAENDTDDPDHDTDDTENCFRSVSRDTDRLLNGIAKSSIWGDERSNRAQDGRRRACFEPPYRLSPTTMIRSVRSQGVPGIAVAAVDRRDTGGRRSQPTPPFVQTCVHRSDLGARPSIIIPYCVSPWV